MILLDTHAWVMLMEDPAQMGDFFLGKFDMDPELAVSVISCLEIAMLVHKGRLETKPSLDIWMSEAISLKNLTVIPLTPEISVKAYQLVDFHGDPADRIIAATSLLYDLPLITKDKKLNAYKSLNTHW